MIRATILGCGSSGGVPRLGGRWGECDPSNPRNRRRRCSLLVERLGDGGITRLLIDTGPDLVAQLLDAGVGELDAVAYTHAHADHIHGIDDLRQVVFNTRRRMPAWADAPTAAALKARFGYIFETPPGSSYPPVCDLQALDGPFAIDGAGGRIEVAPFQVEHGDMNALGFRLGGTGPSLVYLPDVLAIPEDAWPVIMGCDVFICDALRRIPHPSHAHLALTLEWIARSGCARGVITNMHIDLDYDAVMRETPENVVPAYDGMRIDMA
ncbi:phosphoribosyl 1,2-cyclic phosphate phosphodiesterase [Paracoccus thiocyanatus]|uniref:Phosphoribosyl 1,2-cyclic phosphate phosphodiesterase n=1 Tax=Paracoccus thiocyanatus TaxID=34006 RepID=A0A1N6RMW0_9RHOB|nr:MBL fold metallo-hydrolase [Paracoccus thiocyanatus]SIQ30230.1 phosphoribosyl 1,2-cyclic phosphate phosphodiesterase [Paracoccus thiocyanatus]